jgi:hypothetical protein
MATVPLATQDFETLIGSFLPLHTSSASYDDIMRMTTDLC